MALWKIQFYKSLNEGAGPVRIGYIHAGSGPEAALAAEALFRSEEIAADISALVLKKGVELPEGKFLTSDPDDGLGGRIPV